MLAVLGNRFEARRIGDRRPATPGYAFAVKFPFLQAFSGYPAALEFTV
jgi:hypothetical protein